MIEEVFRILKKEGFDIEASELESGKSIRKLCLLMLDVILKLFMMQIAYEQPEGQETSAETCFSKKEQGLSEKLITTLEGKTHKQRNQHPQKSLKRHVWTIARLGGWKGYKTERPPGITTLWIGLRKFNDIKTGWLINQNLTI